MKKFVLLLLAVVFISGAVLAQVSVTIPELTPASNGSALTIPVNVTNFNGIGAITLKIKYNPSVLSFQGSPNPLSGNCLINAKDSTVIIAWYSLTPLHAGTGKLLDLNFNYISGESNLTFDVTECEIADSASKPLTVTYQNGKVNSCVPNPTAKASIGNKVWLDTNKNGIQDAGENGLQWVTVELYDCSGTWKAWASTDADGQFLFSDLTPGDYYVKVYLIDNYKDYNFTLKNAGSNPSLDSDAETLTDSSGKTSCFTLSSGENELTCDIGVIDGVTPPVNVYGSIGDFVWKDLNKNNLQDAGEPGIANVTVKLVDCNNFNVLQTTATGSDGKYLFDSLSAGGYAVQFTAPSGYQFVSRDVDGDDNKDSDADNLHGRSDCITLAAGQNVTNVDCGFTETVTTPAGKPILSIIKTDGLVTMPDSGKSTTYTISYGNSGDGALYNVFIKDTLPEGTLFESASDGGAESPAGSGIVVYPLAQLNPGAQGMVKLKVKVISHESEYLNTAWLSGTDSKGSSYCMYAQDLNFCDTTSSGSGSGVESRGDMAELLLRREWKIRNGLTTPVLAKSSRSTISSNYSLQQIVPAQGPYSSYSVETTPFDILGISNAVSSYAVDYKLLTSAGDRRVGGVFATITTAPYIYDHTKAVCDRLAGSAIEELKLVDVNGYKFYAAKLRKPGNLTDYAISFSVYETPSGYAVENKWTYSEYKAPSGATSVYNFQAWSSSYDGSVQIAKGILANLAQKAPLSYMNSAQVNPDVFIQNTSYSHDGKVHVTFKNNSSSNQQVSVTSYVRYSQGDERVSSTNTYSVQPGVSALDIPVGIVSDAQVEIKDASGFMDEVFVSGGAYTYITGSSSSVSDFRTNGYSQPNLAAYPDGTLLLSGGAYTSGELRDWVTVVRALTTNGAAYNLKDYSQIRFEAHGSGVLTVFVDVTNVTNFNYFAKNVTLNPDNSVYVVNFSDLKQLYGGDTDFDASKIRAVGFMYTTVNNKANSTFNFEVKNIGFITTRAASADDNDGSVIKTYDMAQNYPNPFNPSTTIEFQVPNKEMVSLKVFDVLGQEVASLVNGEMMPGRYTINFNASALSSGVYFYRLHSGSVNITKKMTLTK